MKNIALIAALAAATPALADDYDTVLDVADRVAEAIVVRDVCQFDYSEEGEAWFTELTEALDIALSPLVIDIAFERAEAEVSMLMRNYRTTQDFCAEALSFYRDTENGPFKFAVFRGPGVDS